MSQIYTGRVQDGVVIFEDDTPPLAEGTMVRIEPIGAPAPERGTADDPFAPTRAWLLALAEEAERLAPELPPDMAEHHDHYAHGKPRT
jgi:hypothetical protein